MILARTCGPWLAERKSPQECGKSYGTELLRVVLDRLGVQNLPVVLANLQVLVVVVGKDNLLLIVTQLQIRYILVNLCWRLIRLASLFLFLSLLLFLLELLGRLLGFAGKIFLVVDLATQDSSLCPISSLNAK